MEIVIAASGLPFGPTTNEHFSLGGSETAAIMLGRALKNAGHIVTMFSALPDASRPDGIKPGSLDEHDVRWLPLSVFQQYIMSTEVDLQIVSRDPRLAAMPSQAKKRVLWCHDVATHRGMQMALDHMSWVVDEVWSVSEWHRQQIHKVTGYPLANIVAMRNGIVPIRDLGPILRSDKNLFYAARPERGLENIVKPGGVAVNMLEYNFEVAMYEHFPENMQEYYSMIFSLMEQAPNVEHLGGLTALQTRQKMAQAAAYIYPTQFEETSCLLAREAIEQGTPFLTTKVGALPETLGDCGIYFEDSNFYNKGLEEGSPQWCKQFADFAQAALENKGLLDDVRRRMAHRKDLYWDGVATDVTRHSQPAPVKPASRARSLIMDGDVVAAREYLLALPARDFACEHMLAEIERLYPFLLPRSDPRYETLSSYYNRYYDGKDDVQDFATTVVSERGLQFAEWLKEKKGSLRIFEYGSGEGHILGWLAAKFPQHEFMGCDQVQKVVDIVNNGAKRDGISNLTVFRADTPQDALKKIGGLADIVICTEVLEHCESPWEVLAGVQSLAKEGGEVFLSTPIGPWEWITLIKDEELYEWRNHIWLLDKHAMREMLRGKPNMKLVAHGGHKVAPDMRTYGHVCVSYENDGKPINKLDPIAKAHQHSSRQFAAAAVIAMNNEDTIVKMLNSIQQQVVHVQIALGPSTDRTRELIEDWFAKHPTLTYKIVDVPKIEPAVKDENNNWVGGFGFDDARNASVAGLEDVFDWILWIDTDEVVSGDFTKYLRSNDFDSYIIPQHHHTVQPRGAPAQIDRPARLFRSGRGFTARGKIHEHFEKLPDGGPGRAYMLQDVDLQHYGYLNEDIRIGRFKRNFPLLVWDHDVNDRPLGKYLWFRDIVHRMRYAFQEGDHAMGMALAKDGEAFYEKYADELCHHGAGSLMALEYLAEIRGVLRIGVDIECQLQLGGEQSMRLKGRFKDEAEFNEVVSFIIKDELKRRQDRYY